MNRDFKIISQTASGNVKTIRWVIWRFLRSYFLVGGLLACVCRIILVMQL